MSFLATFFANPARLNLVIRAMRHYAACQDVPAEDRVMMRGVIKTLDNLVN